MAAAVATPPSAAAAMARFLALNPALPERPVLGRQSRRPSDVTPVPNRAEDAAQAAVREVTDAAMADAAQTATLKANVFSMLFGAQQQQQDPTDEAGQSEAAVHVTPAVIIDAKQMMAVVEVTDAGASGDGDHHAHQEASTGPAEAETPPGHAMMEEAPKKTGAGGHARPARGGSGGRASRGLLGCCCCG